MDWSNGCQAALPVIINPYSNPNINVAVSFPTQTLTCNNQSIIATGTSGTSGAQITWQIPSTSSVINSPTVNVGTFTGPGFSNSSTNYANYTVVATNTVNGCQSQSVVPFYQNFSSAGNSSFSYAVGANGVVNFSNTTSGNNPSCIWDFGDGYITVGNSVSHTYSLGGLYPVKLDIYDSGVSCFKTSSSNVNVTSAPCIANTNFTLTSAGIPHQWNLTPAYPWNISNAVWNWGDGSTSNTLYSSHTYSAIGSYSICLTATVSCGTSSSTCNNYFLYKGNSSAPMIQVNVVPPNSIATSIFEDERNSVIYSVYPNPSNNVLNIRAQYLNSETTSIRIYNILGEQVYMNVPEVINGELNKTIQVDNFVNGIYFIEVTSGNGASTKKIVINR
jgi:PKD repeat protein